MIRRFFLCASVAVSLTAALASGCSLSPQPLPPDAPVDAALPNSGPSADAGRPDASGTFSNDASADSAPPPIDGDAGVIVPPGGDGGADASGDAGSPKDDGGASDGGSDSGPESDGGSDSDGGDAAPE